MRHLLADAPRSPRESASAQAPKRRYHELDWLRALIIVALVPAHTLGFFTATTGQYYGTQYHSPVSLSTMMTVGSWGIALLFLVAGAAANFALRDRTPRQYVAERFLRLMAPFLFASLTLIPLQDYLILHNFPHVVSQIPVPAGWNPHYADSPVTFYLYFVDAYFTYLIHYTPQYEFIFWSQLWFIPRLFVISLLSLPLLLFLRNARGQRMIGWLASLCERYRGAVFLLVAPLIVVDAALGWQWQGWEVVGAPDTANVVAQFLFFTIVYLNGFVIYSNERLRNAVRRDGGVVALVVASIAFGVSLVSGLGNRQLAHDYSAGGVQTAALLSVAAWLAMVGVLGLGMRFLAITNRVGQYLSEASYPFYVLHLSVLYLIALPLIASGAPAVLSFCVSVLFTVVVTFAIYELVVRRIGVLRLLFGLHRVPKAAVA